MRTGWLVALAACTAAPAPVAPANTAAPTPSRWTYRLYSSGIESSHEKIATWTIDERAGTVDGIERERRGRATVPWGEPTALHYSLVVSHGAALTLTLSANRVVVQYACALAQLEVAPATAMRASLGGESGKRGRWTVDTRKVQAQVCRPDGDPHHGPPDIVLAPEPIEQLVADDACCGSSPSIRFIPADGSVIPPRDASFAAEP